MYISRSQGTPLPQEKLRILNITELAFGRAETEDRPCILKLTEFAFVRPDV